MKNSSSLFVPMGPLSYLIMTKEGKPLLGLYTYQPTAETVIKVNYEGRVIWYWPTPLQLIDLLENRITVHRALGNMRMTDENLEPCNKVARIKYHVLNHLQFPSRIMTPKKDVVVHPNFYYTFRGHRNSDTCLN